MIQRKKKKKRKKKHIAHKQGDTLSKYDVGFGETLPRLQSKHQSSYLHSNHNATLQASVTAFSITKI